MSFFQIHGVTLGGGWGGIFTRFHIEYQLGQKTSGAGVSESQKTAATCPHLTI